MYRKAIMALNVEDGLKMINKCKKNDLKLFVVKQNRLNSTLQIYEKDKREKIWENRNCCIKCFWHRPQSYYDQDNWRTEELDGGALMNQASHYVDLMDDWPNKKFICINCNNFKEN